MSYDEEEVLDVEGEEEGTDPLESPEGLSSDYEEEDPDDKYH